MSSKAELEAAVPPGTAAAEIKAQIAALQARLHESIAYDPAFTPAELVRWDPSLVGTVLHIQHELDIPINCFSYAVTYKDYKSYISKDGYKYDMQFENPSNVYIPSREWMMTYCKNIKFPGLGYAPTYPSAATYSPCGRVALDRINNIGILGATGIQYMNYVLPTADDISSTDLRGGPKQIEINNFINFTLFQTGVGHPLNTIVVDKCPLGDISFQSIGGKILKKTHTIDGKKDGAGNIFYTMMYQIPLANPGRPLFDQIYIAIHNRLPTYAIAHPSEQLVTVDKYPLSTLYQEWKRDKTAGQLHRRTPLDEAMITIRALQAELRLASEARAAANAHSEKLRAALHASAGIKDSENPV
jgi:hypothetical protein